MVVQCTWKAADGRPILEAVCWSDGTENVDVEDEVKAENCLLLEAPDNGTSGYLTVPACQLLISCDPPNQIQHVSVLSEARVMEIYGHHGEYLKTVRNELLEVVEDMAVFRGDVMFERPLNVCSLKFACLRSKSEMWLYGVKVTVSKADNIVPDHTKIPLAEVERRLKEVGLKLSDKAEAFKQLVEKYQSSTMNQQDIGSMINLLQMSNLIKERSASPDDQNIIQGAVSDQNSNLNMESLKNQANELRTPEIISPYAGASPLSQTSRSSIQRFNEETQTDDAPPGLEECLKVYISEKIEELNKNLLEKVQKSFQEIEAKVMCKLDEIESFVKPHGS